MARRTAIASGCSAGSSSGLGDHPQAGLEVVRVDAHCGATLVPAAAGRPGDGTADYAAGGTGMAAEAQERARASRVSS